MAKLISLTLKSFKKRRAFFLFPVISVAVSVISVVIISSIGSVGKQVVKNEIDSLGLNSFIISPKKQSEITFFTHTELNAIKQCKTVTNASPVVFLSSQISGKNNLSDCLLWGVDGSSPNIMNLQIMYGSEITKSDVYNKSKVCLIDCSYAKQNYGRENVVGKTVQLKINDSLESFKVVGIIDSDKSLVKSMVSQYVPCFVYIPYTFFSLQNGEFIFTSMAASVSPDVDSKSAEKEISNKLFDVSYKDAYDIENLTSHVDTIENILNIVTLILSLIASVSLVISGISVMTVMTFSVRERTREIGIKKAIGASSLKILCEFLTEAVVISLVGCLIGVAFGVSFSFVSGRIINVPLNFDWNMILVCVIITLCFGLVFGIYPALKAARLDPAEALRRN